LFTCSVVWCDDDIRRFFVLLLLRELAVVNNFAQLSTLLRSFLQPVGVVVVSDPDKAQSYATFLRLAVVADPHQQVARLDAVVVAAPYSACW
jgi:hypothetical protein